MCGIIGYVGDESCVDNIRNGLLKVEYRGYDSAGISYVYRGETVVQKRVGVVQNLFDNITCPKVTSAIGHTRWATHGEVCSENAHPHLSYDNVFSLVHNGIIENYDKLRDGVLKDVPFRTDVDTESVVNLIAYIYNENKDSLSSLKSAIQLLDGSFALAILCKNEPNVIYFARRSSPLLVGRGKKCGYVASDILCFGQDCEEFSCLPDGVFGKITATEVDIYDFDGNRIDVPFEPLVKAQYMAELGDNEFFMEKEINEVPSVIVKTAELYLSTDNPFAKIGSGFFENLSKVEFVACGTSYHASKVGAAFVEDDAKIVARTHVASEFVYNAPLLNDKTLVVFVSQSGETADTLHAVKVARLNGAKTLAVTNVSTSNLARMCDFVLPVAAGSEVAVASTKAYNAQVTVLLLFAEYLHTRNYASLAVKIIAAAKAFDLSDSWKRARKFAKEIENAKSVYFVGRHMDYITCLESSLKLKEISYIPCEAYAAGELKHGTIALVEEGTTMIAVITEEKLITKTKNIVDQAKARGANVVYVSSLENSELKIPENKLLKVNKTEVALSPLFTIIPMQMVAYTVAVDKGYNPDRPRNLAKSVTVE